MFNKFGMVIIGALSAVQVGYPVACYIVRMFSSVSALYHS